MSGSLVVRPKTGVVGSVLGICGAMVKGLEYLHLLDFVHGLPRNEFVADLVYSILSSRGTNAAIVVGFALMVVAVWRGRRPEAAKTAAQTALPPAPKLVRERVVVRPVREATAPAPPVDPPPNIIVLDCGIIGLEVDDHGLFKLNARNPTVAAAVVTFRNDAPGGRPVGYMNHTRAHLIVQPAGERTLHVNSGFWLKSDYNTLDIGPGESPMLILAASTLDEGANIVVPNDEREDSTHYDPPTGVGFESDEAKVHVKLVGGWDAQHVFEFDFLVKKKPGFSILEIVV